MHEKIRIPLGSLLTNSGILIFSYMAKPVTEMEQSGIEVQGEGKPSTDA